MGNPLPPLGTFARWIRDYLDSEIESLLEGLETDAGLTGADRVAMRTQIDLLEHLAEQMPLCAPEGPVSA